MHVITIPSLSLYLLLFTRKDFAAHARPYVGRDELNGEKKAQNDPHGVLSWRSLRTSLLLRTQSMRSIAAQGEGSVFQG